MDILLTILMTWAVYVPAFLAAFLAVFAIRKLGILGTAQLVGTGLFWWYVYTSLIFVSAFAVPVMLLRGWEGYTTWFGNYKYGRYGNKVAPSKNFFDEWVFLVLRNPISNFGKLTLSASSYATWPWHIDIQLLGPLHVKAGWKLVKDPASNPERTFLFRPYFETPGGRHERKESTHS